MSEDQRIVGAAQGVEHKRAFGDLIEAVVMSLSLIRSILSSRERARMHEVHSLSTSRASQ
jgi:hypothetical protein